MIYWPSTITSKKNTNNINNAQLTVRVHVWPVVLKFTGVLQNCLISLQERILSLLCIVYQLHTEQWRYNR